MSARTTKPLGVFRDMMHGLADFAKDHDTKPSEVVAEVLSKSGILEELQRSEDPQDASRVDNLSQLQSVAAEFEQNTPDATLAGFLETTLGGRFRPVAGGERGLRQSNDDDPAYG